MMKSIALLSLIFASSLALASGESCEVAVLAKSKQETNLRLAQQAGIHYVSEQVAGYTRQKDEQDAFYYLDPRGKKVTDPAVLERLKSLKIPPAWNQVWISTDPLSHVQARGEDSRGRVQSRYHDLWNSQVKDVAKFERMERFGLAIPKLQESVTADLENTSDPQLAKIAAVVRLLETAGIRIGGEKYAQENQHYGLTTLKVRHVSALTRNRVSFDFIGKEGVAHQISVDDPAIAKIVRNAVKDKQPEDSLFEVKEDAVNKYIKERTSSEFSAKDIRTWVGTVTAAKTLFERGPPRNEKEQKAAELAAATAASERLGNEPGTARDNYIDPVIFAAYRNGHLNEVFNQLPEGSRPREELAVLILVEEQRPDSVVPN